VCRATGHERVDIIGHSMGGVVGRYYVTLRHGSPRVANLLTIGSPHQGAEVSHIGLGRPNRELRAGSLLTRRLHMSPMPADTRLTVIWSRSDALVWGAESARIITAANEIVFNDLGHVSMLVSRRVARALIDVLCV
jgi:triacylglycerol lipase